MMRESIAGAILCSLVAAGLAVRAAERVPGRDPKKLRVLILTGYNMHAWRDISRSLPAAEPAR